MHQKYYNYKWFRNSLGLLRCSWVSGVDSFILNVCILLSVYRVYEDPRASADVSVTLCFSDMFPGVRIPGTYVLWGKLRYSWPLLPLLPPQPVQLDAHTGKTLFLSSTCVVSGASFGIDHTKIKDENCVKM